MPSIELRLYVAGHTPRSQLAIASLERLVEEALQASCELRVIDVTEDPDAAETDRILTTPTLLRVAPAPLRRVTGDFSDAAQVLLGLALDAGGLPPGPEPR
jgi:circadian clock protein KaiB